MQTDTIAAWQVDEGDLITLGSDSTFEVVEMEDRDNTVSLTLKNDEGDCETFYFSWDEDITLVVSLDDETLDELLAVE